MDGFRNKSRVHEFENAAVQESSSPQSSAKSTLAQVLIPPVPGAELRTSRISTNVSTHNSSLL